MEGIQVSTEVAGDQNQITIIKVGGFIDTTTSSEVERSLHGLLKQNRYKIIIDLGNVDYISSAGWGIFISEIKAIRENDGDLKLVRMIPDVYEIFELLEFHHILDVHDSVEEAISSFEAGITQPQAVGMARSAGSTETLSEVVTGASREDLIDSEETDEMPEDAGDEFEAEPSERDSRQTPIAMQSLDNKVKHIVAHNPYLGAYKINKMLNSEKYGYSRVGWFGVRSILSQLGLNSQKNRKKFAQQFKGSKV
ncbi:MAG: STAS domain-containing protein [Calditrichia bacterium]